HQQKGNRRVLGCAVSGAKLRDVRIGNGSLSVRCGPTLFGSGRYEAVTLAYRQHRVYRHATTIRV
ncbi:hypothetical protein, partial [Mycolicibacterium fortuitum]|uniref:hypothetical protein n=1 Tax=Mycolicibacterium fortuitum TaxID=1766 RepID=UPI001A973AB0